MDQHIKTAILAAMVSNCEEDRNFTPANVTDGLFEIARAIYALSKSVEEHAGVTAQALHGLVQTFEALHVRLSMDEEDLNVIVHKGD